MSWDVEKQLEELYAEFQEEKRRDEEDWIKWEQEEQLYWKKQQEKDQRRLKKEKERLKKIEEKLKQDKLRHERRKQEKLKQKKKIQKQEKKRAEERIAWEKQELERWKKEEIKRQEDDRRRIEQMKQSKADERMKTFEELKQWKLECDERFKFTTTENRLPHIINEDQKKQINKDHYEQKGYDSKQNTENSEEITLNQITADVKKEVIQEKHETKTDKNTENDNILEMMKELHRKWKVPAEYYERCGVDINYKCLRKPAENRSEESLTDNEEYEISYPKSDDGSILRSTDVQTGKAVHKESTGLKHFENSTEIKKCTLAIIETDTESEKKHEEDDNPIMNTNKQINAERNNNAECEMRALMIDEQANQKPVKNESQENQITSDKEYKITEGKTNDAYICRVTEKQIEWTENDDDKTQDGLKLKTGKSDGSISTEEIESIYRETTSEEQVTVVKGTKMHRLSKHKIQHNVKTKTKHMRIHCKMKPKQNIPNLRERDEVTKEIWINEAVEAHLFISYKELLQGTK